MDQISGSGAPLGNGSGMSIQQAQMTSALANRLEAMEGAKIRENMVRSTIKKILEMEQEMRQNEFKSVMKWGTGWIKTLGG